MVNLNTILQSDTDTFFLFALSNNFTEIKITVFKKCDIELLKTFTLRDSVERVQ